MPDPRFELSRDARIVVLDDEAVVFNPFTWETHVLNPAATIVLQRFREGSCGKEEVVELLGEVLAGDERHLAFEHAERLIGQLESLRLLVRENDADLRTR